MGIKNGYSLELLTPEIMKLLGSTEKKITKDKYGENVPHLEITEVVLVHCNIVNNDYQQDSRVLYTFLKSFNSEFQGTEVWFKDQNSKSLEIADRINLTLVIKQNIH